VTREPTARAAFSLGRTLSVPSQSVIGEINLLTTVIPGRGRAVAFGVAPLCGENTFCKNFLPDQPNHEQIGDEAPVIEQHSPDRPV
jgi:hypothetical protein